MDIIKQVGTKGADVDAIADALIENPKSIPVLVERLMAPSGTERYTIEKSLREVSQRKPKLLYPYFDRYVDLLSNENNFLKWGAILTIANLTSVDTKGRFEKIFRKYYAPITGPAMVTASNIVKGSATIVSARPELATRIAHQILKIEKGEFEKQGRPSDECRNVVVGQAIETFGRVFETIENQSAIVKFVKRQLDNPRPAVAKKAKAFLAKRGIA